MHTTSQPCPRPSHLPTYATSVMHAASAMNELPALHGSSTVSVCRPPARRHHYARPRSTRVCFVCCLILHTEVVLLCNVNVPTVPFTVYIPMYIPCAVSLRTWNFVTRITVTCGTSIERCGKRYIKYRTQYIGRRDRFGSGLNARTAVYLLY